MVHLRSILMTVLAVTLLGAPPAALAADPVLVQGRVTDATGHPLSATVVVYASTGPTERAAPLATTRTTADGSFTVAAAPAALVDEAAANGGWVNFDLVASDGNLFLYRAIARKLVGATWVATAQDGRDNGEVATPARAAAAASSRPLRLRLSPGAAGVGRVRASARKRTLADEETCYTGTTVVDEQDRWVVVGELHLGKDQAARFTYGREADSDLGVGYSADNSTWSISGAVHVGNDDGAAVTWRRTTSTDDFGRKVKSEFHYKKYKHRNCWGGWWTIKARRWNGGSAWGGDVSAKNNHCGDTYREYAAGFVPDGTFDRDERDYKRYRAAVTAFGVTLSAQSGASTYVKTHWHFGTDYGRYWLCGNNNPPTSSTRIYAGW